MAAVAAARGLLFIRGLRTKAKADDEQNTYSLPDGEDIAAELRRQFARQLRAVLATIPTSGGTLPVSLPDLTAPEWLDPMTLALTPIILTYWTEAGRRIREEMGLAPPSWDADILSVQDAIRSDTTAFCRAANRTTNDRLAVALDEARRGPVKAVTAPDRDDPVPRLRKGVRDVFADASRRRAARIAATEASRAVHAAQLRSAADSGVVAGVEWLVSAGACPVCLAIAAEVGKVRLGERFATIGNHPDYADVRHPPAHPGCRCSIVQILKPEFGGPEDPEWGTPLVDPEPTRLYSPPVGVDVPKPHPGRGQPRVRPKPGVELPPGARIASGEPILPGRPIGERLAAYTDGDRKVDELIALQTGQRAARQGLRAAEFRRDTFYQLGVDESDPVKKRQYIEKYNLAILETKHAREEFTAVVHSQRDEIHRILGVADPQQWKHATPTVKDPELQATVTDAIDFVGPIVARNPASSKASKLRWKQITSDGASYSPGADLIEIGAGNDVSTAVHEFGHHVEHTIPGVREAANAFLAHRVGDEPETRLADLFPGFDRYVTGKKDHFDDYFQGSRAYYVGRTYGDSTEVISMGMQAIAEDPGGFAARDPEYAKLILGILDGSLR